MDKQTTAIEALRSKLQELPRKEVLAIADAAKVARSTVEKFRLNHITEPKASKVERLRKALAASEAKAT
ncbi:hypothetical protein ACSFA8_20790 [Variovorax sp. RT4R15]|uniref:hypothetical protein n=1 Tax=Variovorax sp. RT4R15 TaxID=3443737 RepID=UPI003F44E110